MQVTHIFRDVLHGWGQILLSVNISPDAADYDETAHVLRVRLSTIFVLLYAFTSRPGVVQHAFVSSACSKYGFMAAALGKSMRTFLPIICHTAHLPYTDILQSLRVIMLLQRLLAIYCAQWIHFASGASAPSGFVCMLLMHHVIQDTCHCGLRIRPKLVPV